MNNRFKNFIFICLFCFMFLLSCNNEYNYKEEECVKLFDYEKIDGFYYLEVNSDTESITFDDVYITSYIDAWDFYQNDKLVEDYTCYLDKGNNYFTIKTIDDIQTLIIHRKYSKTINILDKDNNVSTTYTIEEGNNNILEEINKLKPKTPGYYWYQYVNYARVVNILDKQNYNLESVYKKCIYTITYQMFDITETVEVEYLSDFELLISDEIDGYEFVGWYLDDKLFTDTRYENTKDITLVAKYEEASVKLNLNCFNANVTKKAIKKTDGTIELPTPLLNGYKFVGWYYDKYYTNPVTKIMYDEYNNEELFAKFEYDNAKTIDGITYTLRNYQNSPSYDQFALFDKGVSPTATVYWYKLGIKLIDGKYYISTIGESGVKLSDMGDYDYILYCYGNNSKYNSLLELHLEVGMEVVFMDNPTPEDNSDVYNYISFIGK